MGVDISLAGGWIEVAEQRPSTRRGRGQYAPGQRVRQQSRRGDGAVARCVAGAVAAGGAGGDGAVVAAGVITGPDRSAAGVSSGHSAPLDRPVQRGGLSGAGGSAPGWASPAGWQAAGQENRCAAGAARTLGAAADLALPGPAAGQYADVVPAGTAGGGVAAA